MASDEFIMGLVDLGSSRIYYIGSSLEIINKI